MTASNNLKNILTKEFLEKEYIKNKKFATDIAKEIGCNRASVNKYLILFKILKRSPKEIMKESWSKGKFSERKKIKITKLDEILTREFLIEKYEIKKLSISEISKIIKCNNSSIRKRLKKFNIILRKTRKVITKLEKTITKKILIEEYINKKISLYKVAKNFNCSASAIKRLLIKNNIFLRNATEAQKGRKQSKNSREKIKIANIGKKASLETKSKMSLSAGGTGISYELSEYGPEFDSSLKEQVRFRDGYKCKQCGCPQIENEKQLSIHHIDYNKKNNDINNLISLCNSCHHKTNYNRIYWKEYYQKKICV